MPEVFLDDEKVDFQGEAPQSAGAVWAMLEQFLAQQNQLIDRFQVDGVDWLPDENLDVEAFGTIRIIATTHEKKVLEVIGETIENRADLIGAWKAFSGQSLSVAWSELHSQAVNLIQGLQGVIEFCSIVAELGKLRESAWQQDFENALVQLNGALNPWMDALEARQSVLVSELPCYKIIPRLEIVLSLLENEISKNLEETGS